MPAAIHDQSQQFNDAFHQLLQDIRSSLAESSGSDFIDIDPDPLAKWMRAYRSNSDDWSKYAYENKSQCFTRNLVDRGMGKHNIVSKVDPIVRRALIC